MKARDSADLSEMGEVNDDQIYDGFIPINSTPMSVSSHITGVPRVIVQPNVSTKTRSRKLESYFGKGRPFLEGF